MERLTHQRNSGIKTGYWSPNKKDELVTALAAYEDTGLVPEQICEIDKLYPEKCKEVVELKKQLPKWIPTIERLPENDNFVLLSFENFSLPMIGRYEQREDGGGNFYLGDDDEEDTCISQNLFVNAWMPLPKQYREEDNAE